jgi:hypothetical protein
MILNSHLANAPLPSSTPLSTKSNRVVGSLYRDNHQGIFYILGYEYVPNIFVNVLNLHRIDLSRKYHTHLQREIEKEEAR